MVRQEASNSLGVLSCSERCEINTKSKISRFPGETDKVLPCPLARLYSRTKHLSPADLNNLGYQSAETSSALDEDLG